MSEAAEEIEVGGRKQTKRWRRSENAKLLAGLAQGVAEVWNYHDMQKAIQSGSVDSHSLALVAERLWFPHKNLLNQCFGLNGQEARTLKEISQAVKQKQHQIEESVIRAIEVLKAVIHSVNPAYNPFITWRPPREAPLSALFAEVALRGWVKYGNRAVHLGLVRHINRRMDLYRRNASVRGRASFLRPRLEAGDLNLSHLCCHTVQGLCLSPSQQNTIDLLNEALRFFGRRLGDCEDPEPRD